MSKNTLWKVYDILSHSRNPHTSYMTYCMSLLIAANDVLPKVRQTEASSRLKLLLEIASKLFLGIFPEESSFG